MDRSLAHLCVLGALAIAVPRVCAALDAFEPDDTIATAKAAHLAELQPRTLHSSSDVDYIKLYMYPGEAYQAKPEPCVFGLEITVLDAAQTQLAFGQILCEGEDKDQVGVMPNVARPAGTYYFKVTAADHVVEPYTLKVFSPTGDETGRATGIVRNASTMDPIVDAHLVAFRTDNNQDSGSDDTTPAFGPFGEGRYNIPLDSTAPGYSLRIEKPGYETFDTPSFSVPPEGTTTIDYVLVPISSTTPPQVTLGTVSPAGSTQIDAQASILTHGAATSAKFSACSGGCTVIDASPATLSDSGSSQGVSGSFGGLACNTDYDIRAIANNGTGGDQVAGPVTQKTGPCAPTVQNLDASAASSIQINASASVSTRGANTSVAFEIRACPNNNCGGATRVGGSPSTVTDPATDQNVTASFGGLTCNTPYDISVFVSNGVGGEISSGPIRRDTDACPPSISNLSRSPTSTETSLGCTAEVTAGGASTNVSFKLLDGGNLLAEQNPTLAADAVNQTVSVGASDLSCGTSYTCTVSASNSAGSAGPDSQQFATNACSPPDVNGVGADMVGPYTARLIATVDTHGAGAPGGGTPDIRFDLDQAPVGPYVTPVPGSGDPRLPISQLQCAKLYHVTAMVTTTAGTSGNSGQFTTSACLPPVFRGLRVANLNSSGASLFADVVSNGPGIGGGVQWKRSVDSTWLGDSTSAPRPLASGTLSQQLGINVVLPDPPSSSYDLRAFLVQGPTTTYSTTKTFISKDANSIFAQDFE